MPTSQIHEIVAKKIANKYKQLDNYDFYLGSIAPDSVNCYGFAPKEERWNAHIRDKDLSIWKSNIIKYYNDNKNNYNINFFKGYIIHILTDIVYDEFFYSKITLPMKSIGKVGHEAHLYMLDEMESFADSEDFKYVRDILNEDDTLYNIRNINEQILSCWKNRIINLDPPNITPIFLTEKHITELAEKVEEESKKYNII